MSARDRLQRSYSRSSMNMTTACWTVQCIERVQESMETKTDMEPDIHLTVQPTMTVSEVQKEVEKRMGWLPTAQLKRCARMSRLALLASSTMELQRSELPLALAPGDWAP